MVWIDYAFIAIYFVVVIGLGFWYSRRASKNLESYFLGGKSIHWLPLAMSGSVSNFDITGTMWVVSMIYILGMKSMWHHWMWGFLMGAFFFAYMGKWVRRSNIMTAAEWMKTRFGDGPGGKVARLAYALMAIVTLASFVGYAYQGIGKFASVYIPLENLANHTSIEWIQNLVTMHETDVLAISIISITTLYVIMGGLYSVVVTDVIQTVILTVGCVFIAWIAWSKVTPESLSVLPENFTSLRVPWRIPEFAGTDNKRFEFFGGLVIVWVIKGLLLNAGGPGQMYDFQRFLAAKSPKDASKVGAAWSAFLLVRWAMAIGIALLALTGVAGISDTEKIMPIVLRDFLPDGIRGVVIAGLLAAFMSTFSSTVNSGASFIVRDIYQPYFRPNASDKESVNCSYIATLLLVVIGIAIGFQGESIAGIWGWVMIALGGSVIVPNVLRWYWWRLNGWGYAIGLIGGMALAIVVLFLDDDMPVYAVFGMVTIASLVFSVVGSLITKPVDKNTLLSFYGIVKPFGMWKPVRKLYVADPQQAIDKTDNFGLTVLNVILGMIAIFACYVFPMYLVGHWYDKFFAWLAIALVSIVTLYFTWYKNLSSD